MSKCIVMTDTVGINDVQEYLGALFHKTGIELAKLGYFGLYPTDNPKENPKYIFISVDIRVPIGSTVEIMETEEETFP